MAKPKHIPLDKLPPGFKVVAQKGFGTVHDFEAQKVLTGKVLEVRDIPKGGKIKKDTRIMTVQTSDGLRSVWEKAALRELFDTVKKGKEIYIRHDGTKKIPGQKSPMNLFTVAMK